MDRNTHLLNYALLNATQNNEIELVTDLLQDPQVDPSAICNFAIKMASSSGHLEVVTLLLQDPRVDPSAQYNFAIKIASEHGHPAVFTLLLQDPRVDVHTLDPNKISLLTIERIISMNLTLPFPAYSTIKHLESTVREQRQEFIDIIDERTVYNNTNTSGIHREVWKYVVSKYLE
jgi:hypothetical protein